MDEARRSTAQPPATAAIHGHLAGAGFRFATEATELAAYARMHLQALQCEPSARPCVETLLRWHEGQPPRDRERAFADLATMERVDRDLYVKPGALHWFRVDDLRDLYLRATWHDDRLSLEGDFFHRLAKSAYRDRAKRLLFRRRLQGLRQRRFTTLLSYLVYYPCWWWLEHMRDLHPIHAAGVLTDAGVILLAGASGVGKSTLAVALATTAGARLLSDSFVLHQGSEVYAVREPVLLDTWSRSWLEASSQELQPLQRDYGLQRRGYQLPTSRLAEHGRAALLLFPRRAPRAYVRPLAAEQARQRLSAADLMVNDLRRYWAFAAVLEQLAPAGLVARREAHIARLVAEVACYEIGLTADMTSTAAAASILRLGEKSHLKVVGARP